MLKMLDDGELKHRKHFGKRNNPCSNLPYRLHSAALTVINKYRGAKFRADVQKIGREFLTTMIDSVQYQSSGYSQDNKITVNEDIESVYQDKINFKDDFKRKNFLDEPYNQHDCVALMAARLPANYAALSYILNEIRHEEPDFEPSSLFDFGSGFGTTIWAVDQYWGNSIKEVFCVDLNENMNELSRELLQKGTVNDSDILNRIFYRQFLPAKHIPTYDLVVSAFSLLEFMDTRSRIHVVENLWKKTSGALVLVEHGSKAGFHAIMEARNFILQISNKQLDPLTEKINPDVNQVSSNLTRSEGSVLAPCPHDFICPRQSDLLKKSFCNFVINYKVLDYGQPNPGVKKEKFAYVVLKKNNFQQWKEDQKSWPRIVEQVIKNSRHSICRVCTSNGELKEFIFTKSKTEHHLYRCARLSSWGDKLPSRIIEEIVEPESEDPTNKQ